jgi:PAS domain S-box-containing protein/diguanylate cyclase (GGDEF)-like protein
MSYPPDPHRRTETTALVSVVIGFALLALGSIVALGWMLQSSLLVRIYATYPPMSFPTALCFILIGVSLAATTHTMRRWPATLATVAIFLCAVQLLQHAIGIDFGIDRVLDNGWLEDSRPAFGRLSSAAAAAIVLGGIALLLIHVGPGGYFALIAPLIAIAVIFIGLTALLAYLLKMELLFYWQPYARMAMHTSLGVTLLGLGLWARWHSSPRFGPLFQQREDRRMLFTATLALMSATLISGLVGFSMLERHTEQGFKRSLELSLQNNVEIYQDALKQGVTAASAIATRPGIRRELGKLRFAPKDKAALTFLENALTSFLDLGFTAISMEDTSGRIVVRAGRFVDDSQLRIPLQLWRGGELIWNNGFVMHIRRPITDAQGALGILVTEQPLPLVNRLFENVGQLGQSAELSICGTQKETIRCFPTRLRPYFFSSPQSLNGQVLPMTHALQGFTGIALLAVDARGARSIAAYSPVPLTGLGIVISLNAEEMYRPMVQQFQYVLWLLAAVVFVALIVLWLQMKPLSRVFVDIQQNGLATSARLQTREATLNAIMENTNDAIYLKDREGRYSMINAAGARRYGRTPKEVVGKTDAALWPEDVARPLADADRRVLESGEPIRFEETVPLYDGTRHYRVMKAPYRNDAGEIVGVICVANDVTDRRQAENVMRARSLTEELTGLHERQSFVTLADVEISVARRASRALHLFLIHLRNAKDINERLGREHAESARRDLAEVMRRTFRESDILAHLEENEFAALASGTHADIQEHVITRLQRHVEVHNRTARRVYEIVVTIVGVHYDPTAHANLDALLTEANNLMARPIKRGRLAG